MLTVIVKDEDGRIEYTVNTNAVDVLEALTTAIEHRQRELELRVSMTKDFGDFPPVVAEEI